MANMGFLLIVHVKDSDAIHDVTQAVENDVEGARVVGLFRFPERNEPVCRGTSGCKQEGWTRAWPDGHMVHACGYRNRSFRQQLAGHAGGFLDTYGLNLLPRDDTPTVFRNPESHDAHPAVVKYRRRVLDL